MVLRARSRLIVPLLAAGLGAGRDPHRRPGRRPGGRDLSRGAVRAQRPDAVGQRLVRRPLDLRLLGAVRAGRLAGRHPVDGDRLRRDRRVGVRPPRRRALRARRARRARSSSPWARSCRWRSARSPTCSARRSRWWRCSRRATGCGRSPSRAASPRRWRARSPAASSRSPRSRGWWAAGRRAASPPARSPLPRQAPGARARAAVPGPRDDAVPVHQLRRHVRRPAWWSGSSSRVATASIAVGVALYALALAVAYAVPSEVGNNATRLGVSVGVALVVMLAWRSAPPHARAAGRRGVPLALAQWIPAGKRAARRRQPVGPGRPTSSRCSFLRRADSPLGRVEVVPTALHWEAAYVAPYFPLARGWERQLDTGANPIFYTPGALTATSYRTRGCSPTACASSRCPTCRSTMPRSPRPSSCAPACRGCALLWRTAHWRVYAVVGAPGLVSGPGATAELERRRSCSSRSLTPAPSSCANATSTPGAWRAGPA
jgi:hypothetical protein